MSLIRKLEIEEKRLYVENTVQDQINQKEEKVCRAKRPPPPLLLCRTDKTMTFKPAPFEPISGQKVTMIR